MSGIPREDYAAALSGQDAAEARADAAESEAHRMIAEVQHLEDALATSRASEKALAEMLGIQKCPFDPRRSIVAVCAEQFHECSTCRALAAYRKAKGA